MQPKKFNAAWNNSDGNYWAIIQGEAREGGVLTAPWNNSDKNHSDENNSDETNSDKNHSDGNFWN